MKKMILIRGLPGSGKSYLAHDMLHLSGVILCTDDLFTACGPGPNEYYNQHYLWCPEGLGEAHKLNQWKTRVACSKEISPIIIPNTLTTWREVEPYAEIAKNYCYAVQIQEPDTSWKFDVDECTKRNSHGVPREGIQRMKDRWVSTDEIKKKMIEYFTGLTLRAGNQQPDDVIVHTELLS